MITLRITKSVEPQYDALTYLVKQTPVIIEPIEDEMHPSTDTEIIKLIQLDLPSDEMVQALKFFGFLGWEVKIVSGIETSEDERMSKPQTSNVSEINLSSIHTEK